MLEDEEEYVEALHASGGGDNLLRCEEATEEEPESDEGFYDPTAELRQVESKAERWRRATKNDSDPSVKVMARAAVSKRRRVFIGFRPVGGEERPAFRDVYEPVAADELHRLSPEKAAEVLHRAGNLIEDLPSEHRDDAYRFIRGKAVGSARLLFEDWSMAEDFVRAHLPEPMGERSPFQHGGLRDVDLLTLEPPSILIEGLIPQGEVGIITGDSGTGKSWLMAELGRAVAFGGSWLGRTVESTGHVRFFLPEGRISFPERLAGVLMARGLLEPGATRDALSELLDGRVSITDGHTVLNDPRLEDHLRADVAASGTKLVVFDTLNRSLGDGQDENDANDAKAVMNMLHRLAADTGCTFLLVHHPPHGEKRERGSRVWRDAPDFRFLIYGTDRDVREGRPVTLWNVKQRNVPPAEDVGYRLSEKVVEYGGEKISTCTVERATAPGSVPLEDRIRWYVEDHPGLTKNSVISGVRGKDQEVSAEIDRLLADGRLRNANEGKPGPWALHLDGEWKPAEEVFEAQEGGSGVGDA